jgi:uncharacterized glyoxalase superfamily protein PhnB
MASNNAPTVWACLSYRDAPAGIDFLKKAFGFEDSLVVTGDDGRDVHHAELRWPEGGGVMLGSYVEGAGEFAGRPPGVGSIYVVTDQPDALCERATNAGATLVRELRDEDYGSRGFSVADPEGNIWSFGTYRGE